METKKSTKKVKQLFPSEDQEQIKFSTELKRRGIRFFHIPNGGSRYWLEAVKLKKMGTSSGVPDNFIPLPSGNYHGLFIEMKKIKSGKLSDNQVDWISYLRSQGYCAEAAWGYDQAMEILDFYLSLTPKAV